MLQRHIQRYRLVLGVACSGAVAPVFGAADALVLRVENNEKSFVGVGFAIRGRSAYLAYRVVSREGDDDFVLERRSIGQRISVRWRRSLWSIPGAKPDIHAPGWAIGLEDEQVLVLGDSTTRRMSYLLARLDRNGNVATSVFLERFGGKIIKVGVGLKGVVAAFSDGVALFSKSFELLDHWPISDRYPPLIVDTIFDGEEVGVLGGTVSDLGSNGSGLVSEIVLSGLVTRLSRRQIARGERPAIQAEAVVWSRDVLQQDLLAARLLAWPRRWAFVAPDSELATTENARPLVLCPGEWKVASVGANCAPLGGLDSGFHISNGEGRLAVARAGADYVFAVATGREVRVGTCSRPRCDGAAFAANVALRAGHASGVALAADGDEVFALVTVEHVVDGERRSWLEIHNVGN